MVRIGTDINHKRQILWIKRLARRRLLSGAGVVASTKPHARSRMCNSVDYHQSLSLQISTIDAQRRRALWWNTVVRRSRRLFSGNLSPSIFVIFGLS